MFSGQKIFLKNCDHDSWTCKELKCSLLSEKLLYDKKYIYFWWNILLLNYIQSLQFFFSIQPSMFSFLLSFSKFVILPGAQYRAVTVWVISVGSMPPTAVHMGAHWLHGARRKACWMAHLSPGRPSRQRDPPALHQAVMDQAMPMAASLLIAGIVLNRYSEKELLVVDCMRPCLLFHRI